MINIILGLFDKAVGYFVDTPEVKQKKAEMKNELKLAELEVLKQKSILNINATSDYDNQAMKNKEKSWTDEVIAAIHLLPVYGYIIPSETVHSGLDRIWEQLYNAPLEWWTVYFGIVSSTFGLRWLFGKQEVNKMTQDIQLRKAKIREKELDLLNKENIKDKDKDE